MPRVIFVGIHNKPRLEPLCSSTKTGKVIDKIIESLEGVECLKTNIFEVEYMPSTFVEMYELRKKWLIKYQPTISDIIITLGKRTERQFIGFYPDVINLKHPAAIFGKDKEWQYIENVIKLINQELSLSSI